MLNEGFVQSFNMRTIPQPKISDLSLTSNDNFFPPTKLGLVEVARRQQKGKNNMCFAKSFLLDSVY